MKTKSLEEAISNRWRELQEQGVTSYQLAKEYSKLKGADPDDKRYNRYVSVVEKALSDPLNTNVRTLELVKQILGIESFYTVKASARK